MNSKNIKKIAIVFPEFLGDFIMLIPTIHFLKKCVPHAQIDMYTTKRTMQLAACHPAIDNVYLCPEDYKTELPQQLKAQNYDMAYFSKPKLFNALLKAGIRYKIHEQENVTFRLLCIGTPHKARKNNLRHAAQRNINNIEYIFNTPIPFKDYDFSLTLPQDQINHDLIPKTPYTVVIVNGHSVKKYHRDFYLKTINHLIQKGKTVVVDGLDDPLEIVKELPQSPQVIVTVGKSNLFTLFELTKNAEALVSVDTGPSHVAAIYKTPSLIVHPPIANRPSLTAGFAKENVSYKYSPYDSGCDRICTHFQGCPHDDCDKDYNWDDIQQILDSLPVKRSWEEKVKESRRLSSTILFLTSHELTAHQSRYITEMRAKGYFIKILTGDLPSKKDYIHLLRKHKIRVIHYLGKTPPLKLKWWHLELDISERHYCTLYTGALGLKDPDELFEDYMKTLTQTTEDWHGIRT